MRNIIWWSFPIFWFFSSYSSAQPVISLSTEKVNDFAIDPLGRIAVTALDRNIEVWQLPDSLLKRISPPVNSNLSCIDLSADGKLIIYGSQGPDFGFFEWEDSIKPYPVTAEQPNFSKVKFGPLGHFMATASQSGKVYIRDLGSGNMKYIYSRHTDKINDLAFSRDGKILASASEDKTINLLDLETGKPIRRLAGHKEGVKNLTFSPDSTSLASTDGTQIIIWKISDPQNVSGEVFYQNQQDAALIGLSYSYDNKALATATETGHISAWVFEYGEYTLQVNSQIYDIEFVPGRFQLLFSTPSGARLVDLKAFNFKYFYEDN